MQKGKTTRNTENVYSSQMKVVTVENDRKNIEQEIDLHVKAIRSLIGHLRPAERQQYFNGLLSYMLNEEPSAAWNNSVHPQPHLVHSDYSNLSWDDLQLLRELSGKMEELYRTMDHDPS